MVISDLDKKRLEEMAEDIGVEFLKLDTPYQEIGIWNGSTDYLFFIQERLQQFFESRKIPCPILHFNKEGYTVDVYELYKSKYFNGNGGQRT